MGEWLSELCYGHTVEYNSAMEKNSWEMQAFGEISRETNWVKKVHLQKVMYCMISLTQRIQNNKITDMENGSMVAKS